MFKRGILALPTAEEVRHTIKSLGYTFFEDTANKGYDLNIFGIRLIVGRPLVTNIFDDFIGIHYKDETGKTVLKTWEATTDPGTKGVKQFGNKKGVARLKPGQYRGMHYIGKHKGVYEALCQKKDCTVFRDPNKDLVFDEKVTDTGIFGINVHHAGKDSVLVENWSEGCQVFKRIKDFEEFMEICRKARNIHGNSFTYTLLESNQLIGLENGK